MQKNTGTQAITTFNFAGGWHAESDAWTKEQVSTWGESLVDDFAEAHRENETDDSYTAEYGQAQTFEYEVPGMRVVVLLTGGTVMTAWTIENADAARITKAARREQPVTITYTKADGTETVRTIEPTGLKTTKAGDTLILAMDRLSGEKRSFRLDRVSAYTVHRTRRTVRTEAPAPTKTDLWARFQAERTVGEYAVEVTTPADEALAAVVRQALSGPLPEAGTEADGDLMRRLDEAAEADTATSPRVVIKSRAWTGRIVPDSRKFGPSGWSSVVELDCAYSHHSPSGTVRVSDGDLMTLAEVNPRARATV